MARPKRQRGLVGKPVLVDQLDGELGGKLVEAVADDMARARKAREAKRQAAAREAPRTSEAPDPTRDGG